MQQKCSKCKKKKDLTQFSFESKKSNKRNNYCDDCKSIYNKSHYQKNKQKYLDNQRKRKAKVRKWYHDYKKGLICSKCCEDDPVCLQFHHSNPKNKYKTVSVLVVSGSSIEAIKKEIDKCIVLCANCHLKLHNSYE